MSGSKKKRSEDFLKNIKLLEEKISPNKKPDFDDQDIKKAKIQEKSLEDKQREAELERYYQDTTHRNGLVVWAATVVSFWLLCVVFILTYNTEKYKLSDTVMVALLSTTTVNILGLMIIVLNDLFKGKPKENTVS